MMNSRVKSFVSTFLVSGSVLLAHGAFAENATEIFNKNNRTMSPPSRNLKSAKENFEYRIESEAERFQQNSTQNTDRNPDEELSVTTTPVVPPLNRPSGSTSSGSSTGASSQYKFNSQRRGRYSSPKSRREFDGDRLFAVGLVGAGIYGIFGGEMEFAIDDQTSFSMGLGTGMTYATWGLNAKHHFNSSGRMSTYFEAGYANWYMGKAPSSANDASSNYLAKRFFFEGGAVQIRKRVDLIYPALGVLAQFRSGLAIAGELQYLIALHDFSGGLFGSMGMYFFF